MKDLTEEESNYLSNIYFNPEHPASFQNPLRLYGIVQKEGKHRISHGQIKNWIQKKHSYSTNKAVKRHFQRGRVVVSGIDDQWDADLASLIPFGEANDGYKYLFCAIDIFSRYGWVKPIKDKTSFQIIQAFKEILEEGRKPRRLRTDAAKDFTSVKFKEFCKKEKIANFVTHNETQANYVERFIKTIKSKIFRYLNHNNTERYVDILPKIVSSYNSTLHSGIKLEPQNVNKTNESKLWWQMYWPTKKEKIQIKKEEFKKRYRNPFIFKIGDKVRMSHLRKAFQREYDSKWSHEIFKVSYRFMRQDQPLYEIKDWFGEKVQGTFYQKELQKVDAPAKEFWKINNILKYKGVGQNRKALVSWVGWPKKFNSWLSVNDINNYNPKV